MSTSPTPNQELTWTKAVLLGLGITVFLLLTLGWIPSHFVYFWWAQINAGELLSRIGIELKDPYTLVRLRDAISQGYQTTLFAALIIGAYIWGERKRRRLGQQGAGEPRDYLPGK
ncbi:MAG: hypothetical protein ACRDI1_01520 [Actinomycetota bacterium]